MCVGCDLLTAKDALKEGIVDQIIPILPMSKSKNKNESKDKNGKSNSSDLTNIQKRINGNNADGNNADGNKADDPNSTDDFIARMIVVLENQIARGPMAPNPFKRTR